MVFSLKFIAEANSLMNVKSFNKLIILLVELYVIVSVNKVLTLFFIKYYFWRILSHFFSTFKSMVFSKVFFFY